MFSFFVLQLKYANSSLQAENNSRAWFRSTDLWVMGPARFHCATLLSCNHSSGFDKNFNFWFYFSFIQFKDSSNLQKTYNIMFESI